jgi:hypothetical protein
MVLDIMEPLRPVVDRYVLSLLASRPLRKADLFEEARGVVRLRAPLTWELARGMDEWRHDVGRLVEEVADLLGRSSPYDVSVPTVLTRTKHRQAARTRVAAADLIEERAPVSGGTNRRKATQRPRSAPVKVRTRTAGPSSHQSRDARSLGSRGARRACRSAAKMPRELRSASPADVPKIRTMT